MLKHVKSFIVNCNLRRLSLKPAHEIQLCDSDYQYKSIGNDPYFIVKTKQRLRRGWYMLTLNMQSSHGQQLSKLYIDYGKGFNEEDTILIKADKTDVKRVCYLKSAPVTLRFDPMDKKGKFSVIHLNLLPLPAIRAKSLMRKKIHNLGKSLLANEATNGVAQKYTIAEQYKRYDDLLHTLYSPKGNVDWHKRQQILIEKAFESKQQTNENIKISVIVPVYNTPMDLLTACIDSVLKQSYANWQLCLADDKSTSEETIDYLNNQLPNDDRISIIFRKENGNISEATNSALELATGDYIALLDHDDCLHEHALSLAVSAIQRNPRAQVLYTDEDKINYQGEHSDPHFKSDWNRDLLYSQNYICHLGIYKKSLVDSVGGMRSTFNGSQDYDFLLRCIAKVTDKEIIHIPYVLYHWRAVEGSTALSSVAKSYTHQAGKAALVDYFKKQAVDVEVRNGRFPNTYRVKWPVKEPAPLVSLMIPTRDGFDILSQCIHSILEKTDYPNYEILIINNQSSCKQTLDYLNKVSTLDRVNIIDYNRPFNFSAINNYAAKQTKGDIIGLINNDIEVINNGWLTEMVSHCLRKPIGCVGAKLYYGNGRIQHAGVILGIGGVAGHAHKYFADAHPGYFSRLHILQNLSAVTGACLLVRKEIYEKVNGLTEDLKVAFNDVDFCLKVREAGYTNLWTPYAKLYHHESVSRGEENTPEKQKRFLREVRYMQQKWGNKLDKDPFYSPNLSLISEDFSYR